MPLNITVRDVVFLFYGFGKAKKQSCYDHGWHKKFFIYFVDAMGANMSAGFLVLTSDTLLEAGMRLILLLSHLAAVMLVFLPFLSSLISLLHVFLFWEAPSTAAVHNFTNIDTWLDWWIEECVVFYARFHDWVRANLVYEKRNCSRIQNADVRHTSIMWQWGWYQTCPIIGARIKWNCHKKYQANCEFSRNISWITDSVILSIKILACDHTLTAVR